MVTSIKAAVSNEVGAVRRDLEQKVAEGERAKAALSALDLVFSGAKHYGNGEPDAELAAAAGLRLMGHHTRPDKWRRFLKLRRDGLDFWKAQAKAAIHPDTAKRLEPLV